jgi:hypothetical protein
MTAHQKNSDTLKLGGGIAVAVLLLAMIAMVVYSNMRKEGSVGTPIPVSADWSSSSLDISGALERAFPETEIGDRGLVSLQEKVDLTGDGIPEAFVDMGTGGASTEYISLLRLENGKVVVIRAKDINGAIAPLQLLQGAAVLHSSDIGTVPKEGIVYQRELAYSPEDGSVASCTIEAYVWNKASVLFEYNPDASLSLQAQRCMQQ